MNSIEDIKKSLRIKAINAVAWAVKTGKLTRPNACNSCSGTDKRIDAHHHNYFLPLDIEWLCTTCHYQRHKTMRDNSIENVTLLHLFEHK